MTKDFNYITSRGLPGGPNQEITYVTGVFSVEGYRYDSPDKNNSVNLIESGNISMSENDGSPLKKGPLHGIDNLGNKQIMMPGMNYQFPGDQVFEMPMAQIGVETKEWIKNWIETRKATGKFEGQLGNGQMEKGFKSLDNVKKVSREEMVEAGNDDASFWQFNAPNGMYVPSDNIYFSDPGFFSGNKEEDTDIHEQSHVFDIGTSGLPGKDMKESIPETNIHKAIKNIPVKGGYETEDYLPPAEIYAELMKFRKKNNIDPNKIYTEDDLLELRKKLKEENDYGLFKLDDIYEDKEILRLMNEVATIDTPQENNIRYAEYGGSLPKAQDGGCASCTESMRQREGSYNKGREYILDPRFKQQGGSTTDPYTIYMNYINGLDDSETAKNIFDKLNRMHYKDAKEQGMGVANYIATNVISAS